MQLIITKIFGHQFDLLGLGPFNVFSSTEAQQPNVRIESNFRNEKSNDILADHEKF